MKGEEKGRKKIPLRSWEPTDPRMAEEEEEAANAMREF